MLRSAYFFYVDAVVSQNPNSNIDYSFNRGGVERTLLSNDIEETFFTFYRVSNFIDTFQKQNFPRKSFY
jgi:hypothetical protein